MMDAPEHTPLRKLAMAGFNRAALTDYVPRLQKLADASIARWVEGAPRPCAYWRRCAR